MVRSFHGRVDSSLPKHSVWEVITKLHLDLIPLTMSMVHWYIASSNLSLHLNSLWIIKRYPTTFLAEQASYVLCVRSSFRIIVLSYEYTSRIVLPSHSVTLQRLIFVQHRHYKTVFDLWDCNWQNWTMFHLYTWDCNWQIDLYKITLLTFSLLQFSQTRKNGSVIFVRSCSPQTCIGNEMCSHG